MHATFEGISMQFGSISALAGLPQVHLRPHLRSHAGHVRGPLLLLHAWTLSALLPTYASWPLVAAGWRAGGPRCLAACAHVSLASSLQTA